MLKFTIRKLGGRGSGNIGHKGLEGVWGGSSPKGGESKSSKGKFILRLKRRIESAELTKRMYPEFKESQNKIITKLKGKLKDLGVE